MQAEVVITLMVLLSYMCSCLCLHTTKPAFVAGSLL